jgi:CO dehydrogenase/acetyl-CoA synthase gamma subunit (corrinoid Fe-S protein)
MTRLSGKDRMGRFRSRVSGFRMYYRVDPGLYAVGSPNTDSPVLVSANYKLSFNTLRSNLDGLDAYILVLDTKGINVWCAAGKGTFGT